MSRHRILRVLMVVLGLALASAVGSIITGWFVFDVISAVAVLVAMFLFGYTWGK